jgi:hypothetical protein
MSADMLNLALTGMTGLETRAAQIEPAIGNLSRVVAEPAAAPGS